MNLRRSIAALSLLATTGCDDAPIKQPNQPPSSGPTSAAAESTPSASASAQPAPPPTRPAEPLNVLLISIDSMRADMPWAGYERKIAPNLTKLAGESVVYERGYSVSSYTAKSVGALLTGRYPSAIYRDGYFFTGYAKSNLFFTEVLQKRGARTIGGHAHMYFGRGKNLDQGFDVWKTVPGISFNSQTDEHVTSDKMTVMAKELLGDPANTKGQFFAWFHYMDPHDQYVKHKESPDFGKKNRDRYDSEMFYTDLHIGKLLDWAKTQAWWKKTAVVVTADHGEAFGEHKMWKHAFEIWEVLTRVPIMFRLPDAKARRIKERRSHIDLGPTILDLMGVKTIPEAFMGKTMVPELYGKPAEPREPLLLELAEDSHNPPRRALIQGDYKLIVYGKGWKRMLFNLKTDPGEEKDLSKDEPEKLEEMKKLFEESWSKVPSVEPYGGAKLKGGKSANGPRGPKQ